MVPEAKAGMKVPELMVRLLSVASLGDAKLTVKVPDGVLVRVPEVTWITAVPARFPENTALFLSPETTRSLSATPPVLFISDHVPAALATKLPYWSLVTA